jgi:acyl-homoserine lactone acylase PvdQ
MIKKLVCYLFTLVALLVIAAILGVFYIYKPVTSGTLYLENAMGEAEIFRETDTSIPHVYATNEKMALYTEGFLHA